MSQFLQAAAVPDSALARWDARWKLAALALAILAVASIRHPIPAAVALLLAAVVAALARVDPVTLLGRLGILLLALAPILVVLPLTSVGGLATALAIGFRGLAIGTLAIVLVRTAPLADTFAAAHRLRVPGPLILITQLAHRYSLLFLSEWNRLRVAMRARGFRPATAVLAYEALGSGAGTLLVRGGDRAERVADAMRARGFDGDFHSLRDFHTRAGDVGGLAVTVLVSAGLVAWDRLT